MAYRETNEVAAAVVRLIRSVGRRIAMEDPDDLRSLRLIEWAVAAALTDAVEGLRVTGYTDAQIGAALGVTKQAVQQRFPRAKAA